MSLAQDDGSSQIELQQFGELLNATGKSRAMLCIDADKPSEVMIHCFGGNVQPIAILFNGQWDGDELHLRPKTLFRIGANGSLIMPPTLNEQEAKGMRVLKGTLKRRGRFLSGKWSGPDGKSGTIRFRDRQISKVWSAVEPFDTWAEFKSWASRVRIERDAISFRGHGSNRFELRTTLHRIGRNRLERYCGDDLINFSRHAEAVLGMRFNLNDGDDFATVMGLAQHHGFPTPLLDWSASPYVAAFFAFTDALDSSDHRVKDTHVRIYALTRKFIEGAFLPVVPIPRMNPYVASLKISARHNARLYAQQGQFIVTNLKDLEPFIRQLEIENNETYLLAADVPISCASEALEDLAFMGLTAASLFPGLDGVGRMLKHQMLFSGLKAPTHIADQAEAVSTEL